LTMGKQVEGEPERSPYYPLSALLPIHGKELFELASRITPNIAYYLPRNVDLQELADLAPYQAAEEGQAAQREYVEVEEEWVGYKLKAVTAYYGGLADLSST
jgi:trimethylguanosine synthase